MELDFCHSLGEITENLGAANDGPMFAYTQPQNVRIFGDFTAGREIDRQ